MTKTLPKGHASCLSKAFKYVPSGRTDLAATFRRVRREMAAAQANVTPIIKIKRRLP